MCEAMTVTLHATAYKRRMADHEAKTLHMRPADTIQQPIHYVAHTVRWTLRVSRSMSALSPHLFVQCRIAHITKLTFSFIFINTIIFFSTFKMVVVLLMRWMRMMKGKYQLWSQRRQWNETRKRREKNYFISDASGERAALNFVSKNVERSKWITHRINW